MSAHTTMLADDVGARPNDAAVIRASLGNGECFSLLYDRYAEQLFRYAARRLGPECADDVVSETFLAAFRRRHRYDLSYLDARPWLFGIITKQIAGRKRTEMARYRALARTGPEPVDDGLASRVAEHVSATAARAGLVAALAALKPGDRDVLLLVAWNDFTYQEVADALGIKLGTVRSRLHRAREQVRAAFGDTNPIDFDEEK
ncbi:RNA polymerase sigma factor [Krasilnikovia sp. MM14-A1259]|uniref:RNA polymerase sigma factor n=1 Tax=Krasilnikovia sp. MM14-A1259 TaxID=3373539 RepID=UPI00399D4DE0